MTLAPDVVAAIVDAFPDLTTWTVPGRSRVTVRAATRIVDFWEKWDGTLHVEMTDLATLGEAYVVTRSYRTVAGAIRAARRFLT